MMVEVDERGLLRLYADALRRATGDDRDLAMEFLEQASETTGVPLPVGLACQIPEREGVAPDGP